MNRETVYPSESAGRIDDMLATMRDDGARPLSQQLLECIRRWIALGEPGDRLPAERWLAERAKVNRGTLRKALTELVNDGLLERGPRGTLIARKGGTGCKPAPSTVVPHPLFSVMQRQPYAVQTIRIAVFENLPNQKLFWRRTCEILSSLEPNLQLILEWVPEEIATLDRYAEFIADRRCDLVVFCAGMADTLRAMNILSPIHDELRKSIALDSLWWSELSGNHDPLLPWGVPVHLSLPLLFWNRQLLPGAPEIYAALMLDEFMPWLAQAACTLEGSASLLSNPLVLSEGMGLPAAPMTDVEFRNRTGRIFSLMKELKGYPIKAPCGLLNMVEYTRHFVEGEVAVYLGPTPVLFNHLPRLPWPWMCNVLLPEEGQPLAVSETAVGLTQYGRAQEAAERLLSHLVGPEIQRLVATIPVNFPLRRDCLPLLAEKTGCPAPHLKSLLQQSRFLNRQQGEWPYFLQQGIAPLLQRLLEGKEEPGDAAYQCAHSVAQTNYHLLCPAVPGR